MKGSTTDAGGTGTAGTVKSTDACQPAVEFLRHRPDDLHVDYDDLDFDPLDFAEDDAWLDEDDPDDGERTFHEQSLAEWGDRHDLVDREMAPLLSELWRAGVGTYSSCQDLGESLADLAFRHPHMAGYVDSLRGRASIDFVPPDAQLFLDLVAAAGPPPPLYDRMTRWTAEGAWSFNLPMLDLPDGAGGFSFRILSIQLHFPRADLPEVTGCVRRHNQRADEARKAAAGS